MNESTPPGRGKLIGLIVALLLGAGALLLLPELNQLINSRAQTAEEIGVTTPPTASAGDSAALTSTDGKVRPTPSLDSAGGFPAIPSTIAKRPAPQEAAAHLDALYAISPPVHDYFQAAETLGGLDLGERVVAGKKYGVGDRATFHTNDGSRQAELVYMDSLAEYWVETGVTLDREDMIAAAQRLRERYYPLLVRNIGREWQPGVDGETRFTVLHTLGAPDTYELGYFSDENQYPRALFPTSNEREMIYLNMAQLEPGPLYDGTLVHEVQHLIQWNLDANEDKWFNEGLSQLTETMAELATVDPRPYLEQTQIRLDGWSEDPPDIYAHYAGSYLYLLYFWEQLGDAAITELARHPANGLAAVRVVLAGHEPARSLERFTGDWATALYVDGRSDDARFNINTFELPQPFFANRIRQLPYSGLSTLEQFGVDVIDLDFSGPATLTFAGDSTVELLDALPNGDSFWFAPPANSSRAQLTADVDLTGATNPALSFYAWYDLELDYDFAYISASTDGGRTWRPLETERGILGAYGPAWGGRSADLLDNQNGWLAESVSLEAYAGRKISLRFDVVTDFEEVGRGFAVSELAITGIADQPEWRPEGFVNTGHVLPQRWEVRLIRDDGNEVIPLNLDERNQIQTAVELGPEGGALIVIPLNPFVESAANYWVSVTK